MYSLHAARTLYVTIFNANKPSLAHVTVLDAGDTLKVLSDFWI